MAVAVFPDPVGAQTRSKRAVSSPKRSWNEWGSAPVAVRNISAKEADIRGRTPELELLPNHGVHVTTSHGNARLTDHQTSWPSDEAFNSEALGNLERLRRFRRRSNITRSSMSPTVSLTCARNSVRY